METYCNRQGKDMSAVRFMYDGIRIKPETTPNEVNIHKHKREIQEKHRNISMPGKGHGDSRSNSKEACW